MALLDFVLVAGVFFMEPVVFFVFMVIFSFYLLNNFSWGGLFFYLDSYSFVLLVIMSLFILGVVVMSEKSGALVFLSEVLVFICVFFFVPSTLLMFYMFFELSMLPIMVMILGYGLQIEKINSAYYLIFYAAFCSMPFLFVYFSSIVFLDFVYFDLFLSWEVVFVLSLSFMMKFPVYFLHLWLPKAHVEAPTTASMLLAGLLLKLGTMGFLRIMGSLNFVNMSVWAVLAFMGMILASLCCIFQSDSKALAAYSSVTHMSFLLMSLVFVIMVGKTSSIILMLAHGYTSTLMFYLIGEFYHVSGSRLIYYLGGFMSSSLIMAIVFGVVFLSNSGTPPSLSFVSEFVSISSVLWMGKLSIWVLFLYFFLAFYYSIYILSCGFMGKEFVDFNFWNLGFAVPFVFMMFNVFWMSVFF